MEKEFLRTFWCLLAGTGPRHKELYWDYEELLLICFYFGRGGEQRKIPKGFSYGKEDLKDPGGLAMVKLRWFFL